MQAGGSRGRHSYTSCSKPTPPPCRKECKFNTLRTDFDMNSARIIVGTDRVRCRRRRHLFRRHFDVRKEMRGAMTSKAQERRQTHDRLPRSCRRPVSDCDQTRLQSVCGVRCKIVQNDAIFMRHQNEIESDVRKVTVDKQDNRCRFSQFRRVQQKFLFKPL